MVITHPSDPSSDLAVPHPDKKSVIMYVTSLFRVLPQSVSMEAIKEVETLPRAAPANVSRVTTEEHYEIQTQQRFSQQVRHTSPYGCHGCHGGIARAHFLGGESFNLQILLSLKTQVLCFLTLRKGSLL